MIKQNKILHIHNADDIVRIFLVNRDTGKAFLLEQLHELVKGCVYIYHDHIDTRHHNILGHSIPEIEYVVDHLLFFALNNAFLMAYFHDRPKLILCHGILLFVGVYTQKKEDCHGQLIDNEDHRSQNHHQHMDGTCIGKRDFLRIQRGHGLWRDLTEYQDQQCQHTGGHANRRIAEHAHGQGCHQGRG